MNNDQSGENNGGPENLYEQAGAFQKIWAESLSRMAQAAFTFTPEGTPPELARQIRSGIFQAVAQSWDEFMRSPQFLQAMKQMMDNAISLRKVTNDFLTRAHHEMQGTARTDVDTLMIALRHLETRVLDRIDALSKRMDGMEERMDGRVASRSAGAAKGRGRARPKAGGAARVKSKTSTRKKS